MTRPGAVSILMHAVRRPCIERGKDAGAAVPAALVCWPTHALPKRRTAQDAAGRAALQVEDT
jgi:hypothetical protein